MLLNSRSQDNADASMCNFWERYWIEVSCVPSIVLDHTSHNMALAYRHVKFVAVAWYRSILAPSIVLHYYNMAFVKPGICKLRKGLLWASGQLPRGTEGTLQV